MNVLDKVKSVGGNYIQKASKYAPGALMVAGIGGVIVATVLACKQTRKAEGVLEQMEAEKHELKEKEEALEMIDYKKTMAKIYMHSAKDLCKVYAKPAALGVVSIGCIVGSHHIMNQRLAGAAAAYTALDSTFRRYRKNVVERFGEEIDRDIRMGRREVEEEVETVDKKTGEVKTKKVKKTIEPNLESLYDLHYSDLGRWFAPMTSNQFKSGQPEYNIAFLKGAESYFNNLYKYGKKQIFLNEVYKYLGFKETKAGQVVGWSKGHPFDDGEISFRIKVEKDYNGEEVYFLDFNVCGNMLDHCDLEEI